MPKIFICDKVESAPLSSIKNINNGITTFYNPSIGFKTIEDLVSGIFNESSSVSDPGTLAIQILDLKCEMAIDAFINMTEQPSIFRLRFSDGRVQLWGSLTNPVQRRDAKREINSTQIIFERKSQVFEF